MFFWFFFKLFLFFASGLLAQMQHWWLQPGAERGGWSSHHSIYTLSSSAAGWKVPRNPGAVVPKKTYLTIKACSEKSPVDHQLWIQWIKLYKILLIKPWSLAFCLCFSAVLLSLVDVPMEEWDHMQSNWSIHIAGMLRAYQ